MCEIAAMRNARICWLVGGGEGDGESEEILGWVGFGSGSRIRREGEQCHRRQDTQPATRPNQTQQKTKARNQEGR